MRVCDHHVQQDPDLIGRPSGIGCQSSLRSGEQVRLRLKNWSREAGSAVPYSVSPFIADNYTAVYSKLDAVRVVLVCPLL